MSVSARAKLYGSILTEEVMAEIYTFFASAFPEMANFWNELAREEEKHAEILKIGSGFAYLKEKIALPSEMGGLRAVNKYHLMALKALEFVRGVPVLTDYDALQISLILERGSIEMYFRQIMTKRGATGDLRTLQRFYEDEVSHTQRIKKVMKQFGYPVPKSESPRRKSQGKKKDS